MEAIPFSSKLPKSEVIALSRQELESTMEQGWMASLLMIEDDSFISLHCAVRDVLYDLCQDSPVGRWDSSKYLKLAVCSAGRLLCCNRELLSVAQGKHLVLKSNLTTANNWQEWVLLKVLSDRGDIWPEKTRKLVIKGLALTEQQSHLIKDSFFQIVVSISREEEKRWEFLMDFPATKVNRLNSVVLREATSGTHAPSRSIQMSVFERFKDLETCSFFDSSTEITRFSEPPKTSSEICKFFYQFKSKYVTRLPSQEFETCAFNLLYNLAPFDGMEAVPIMNELGTSSINQFAFQLYIAETFSDGVAVISDWRETLSNDYHKGDKLLHRGFVHCLDDIFSKLLNVLLLYEAPYPADMIDFSIEFLRLLEDLIFLTGQSHNSTFSDLAERGLNIVTMGITCASLVSQKLNIDSCTLWSLYLAAWHASLRIQASVPTDVYVRFDKQRVLGGTPVMNTIDHLVGELIRKASKEKYAICPCNSGKKYRFCEKESEGKNHLKLHWQEQKTWNSYVSSKQQWPSFS